MRVEKERVEKGCEKRNREYREREREIEKECEKRGSESRERESRE